MKNMPTFLMSLAGIVALAGCVEDTGSSNSPTVVADPALASYVGARAGQAEMGLQNMGYELIRSDGLTGYWFKPSTGACAAITTADGRYASINMLPAQDC